MKIVKVQGGLGNQLFHYAFARALEERTGDEVFLDLSTYGYAAAHNGFELDRLFAVRYRVAAESDIDRLGTRPLDPLSAARRKFLTKRTHHIDRLFSYDPRVFGLKGDRYLEGWWQTESYFAPIEGRIREELAFIADPGERNRIAVAGDAAELAAVHVRRGDALKNPDTWVCTEAYYRRALEELRRRRGAPRVLVFSDDLDWCRDKLGLDLETTTFVDWNRGTDSWRDLWLMSRCGAAVIANSTFSWWAAWLNPDPKKLVMAPERWSLARPRPFSYYRYAFDEVVPAAWTRIPIE